MLYVVSVYDLLNTIKGETQMSFTLNAVCYEPITLLPRNRLSFTINALAPDVASMLQESK